MNSQEEPSTMIENFPRRQLWGGCAISKKLILHFDQNVFSIIVCILSQLIALVEKFPWTKSTVWKTALIPQYLLTRWWFHWNGLSCVFTNTMNNSAPFKDRELWLLVLFLLIILEMRSSAALECAAFVCFLRKLCVWEKSTKSL